MVNDASSAGGTVAWGVRHHNGPWTVTEWYGTALGTLPVPGPLGCGGAKRAIMGRPGVGDHLAATVDPDIREQQAAVFTPRASSGHARH